MIPEYLVTQIIDTADIVEVVSDFIPLKKRGANYTANCPFHNEKSPSFSVSAAKGIYKCFGCGNAGNAVKFVMEHEKMTFPEALGYLAQKYNIDIPVQQQTDEYKEEQQYRDSLYIINDFALKHFQRNLLHSNEGKSIGLSYFKDRGFRENTIAKFELGYSLDNFDTFIEVAKQKGYTMPVLEKLGLVRSKNNRFFPFFRGRVQFAIHNLSGKVIAFAGRTLKTDKKSPKYINSPETDIYVKNKVLYGMHLAKQSIRQFDNCFLVEGYTDVISMVQAGIENVVASSGTSLTEGQIALVKRYTNNVTFIFDGDAAGIKAALRGVDIVLQQGLNVQVVSLPPDQDPDSFVQKEGKAGFEAYIKKEGKDFVLFKTDLLLKDAGDNPIKRSEIVRQVIATLAKIPDPIKRAFYIQSCSQLLDIAESIIINETNRLRLGDIGKKQAEKARDDRFKEKKHPSGEGSRTKNDTKATTSIVSGHELNLISCLIKYGHLEIEEDVPVAASIIIELEENEVNFDLVVYQNIIEIYSKNLEEGNLINGDYFIAHPNDAINKLAIDVLATRYQTSYNWELKHNIIVPDEGKYFKKEVFESLKNFINEKKTLKQQAISEQLKQALPIEKQMELLTLYQKYNTQIYSIKTVGKRTVAERWPTKT